MPPRKKHIRAKAAQYYQSNTYRERLAFFLFGFESKFMGAYKTFSLATMLKGFVLRMNTIYLFNITWP
jgi:hypothetical protein